MKRYLIISMLLLVSCSKDQAEESPFRSPDFFQGQWKSPTEEFLDGSSFTWFEFEFTNQTIIEIDHLNKHRIDYKQTFPADRFEIIVQKSERDFEITITSKFGDSIPFTYTNRFYRRFARLPLWDGSNGIELLWGGTSGEFLIRK